jgi:small-conductance mechanosensitive channel
MNETAQTFLEQWRVILLLLNRPIVQQQLLIIVGILAFSILINTLLRRRFPADLPGQKLPAATRLLRSLLLPLLILLSSYLFAALFARFGYSVGLLLGLRAILWYFLGYRLLVGLAALRFRPDTVQFYDRRLIAPLFALLLLRTLINLVFGSVENPLSRELFRIDQTVFTLRTLLAAFGVVYLAFLVLKLVEGGFRHWQESMVSVDNGVLHAVSTIGRYTIIAVAVMIALRILGLPLTSFAIIGGGLSVGIGFGLQTIVANFISGIVLMFEQSLRPGDMIQLGDRLVIVRRLNIRSTLVRTFDNVEIVIPNQDLLTSHLVTYTGSDRIVRGSFPVGVSYTTDPEHLRTVLVQAALTHPYVLKDPAPDLSFTAFGDSSLDFLLLFWVSRPHDLMRIRSELHFTVFDALRRNNIEIPFPQRDLNPGPGWAHLARTLHNSPAPETESP